MSPPRPRSVATALVAAIALALAAAGCAGNGSDDRPLSATGGTSTSTVVITAGTVPGTTGTAPSTATSVTAPIRTIETIEDDQADGLVSWTFRGGLCPEGMCEATYVLRADGSATTPQVEHPAGTFAEEAEAVAAATGRVDVTHLELEPFTGTCPTAYDGQEQMIIFLDSGFTVASCTVVIDPARAPFDTLDAAITAIRAAD